MLQSTPTQINQKAISLSWFGYFTSKPIPPEAYVVWEKLSEESKTVFKSLSEKHLGEF